MTQTRALFSNDPISAMNAVRATISSGLKVALPGIIKSFDPKAVTCVVKVGLRQRVRRDNGQWRSADYPLLVDVPVVFPRGGGCTLTFPLTTGDECLVVFADRAIDNWWQNGGTQEVNDERQHSLSDAFVLPGPQSQARKISDISAQSAQLRTDDGKAFIELTREGEINVTTPGTITLNAGQVTINAPVNIEGELTVSQDARAAGISLMTHLHSGVESGHSTTGKPQ